MSVALENIKQIISNSDISPEEQNDLLVFLPVLPEKVLEDLNDILQKNPEWLKEFNGNFKAKLKALTGQTDEWDEIIKKEAEEAGELSTEEEEIEKENSLFAS